MSVGNEMVRTVLGSSRSCDSLRRLGSGPCRSRKTLSSTVCNQRRETGLPRLITITVRIIIILVHELILLIFSYHYRMRGVRLVPIQPIS